MQIARNRSQEMVPAKVGWTYPGVIILTSLMMITAMAVDLIVTSEIGLISNIGILAAGILSALKVRTADYQAAIWVVPIAWVVSLLTVGQFAPMPGGTFFREQALHLAYGLAMHAWWILGATAASSAIAVFRRGRQP